MKTIATINFKGGVGKTTVTWCLGDMLSTYSDFKVLLFDLDAQMSMTQAISLNEQGQAHDEFRRWQKNQETVFSALVKFLQPGGRDDFHPGNDFVFGITSKYHFVPSTEKLYWLELGTHDPKKGKFFVKDLLGKIDNSGALPNYDYALFDCPPSFTLLSYSVLTCCDLILIPVNPDFFAAKRVDLLIRVLHERIKPHQLPKIAVFANQVKTWRRPTKAAQGWIHDIKQVCQTARDKLQTNIRFLDDAWVPDRASVRDAITKRGTPREVHPNFRLLWVHIESILR